MKGKPHKAKSGGSEPTSGAPAEECRSAGVPSGRLS